MNRIQEKNSRKGKIGMGPTCNRVMSKLLVRNVVEEIKPEAAVFHPGKVGVFYRFWCMDTYNNITNCNHN